MNKGQEETPDVELMGEEELSDFNEQTDESGKETPDKDQPGDQSQQEADSQDTGGEEEGEETEEEETDEEEEEETPPEDWTGDEKSWKRYKETQQAFTKKSQEAKAKADEAERLKLENEKYRKLSEFQDFKELSAEEQEDLKNYDPDEYVKYKQRELERKNVQDSIKEDESAYVVRQVEYNFLDALSQLTDLEVDLSKPLSQQSKEVIDIASSEKMGKVGEYLRKKIVPDNDMGIYSAVL